MHRKIVEQTGIYEVKDSDGNVYTLTEFTQFNESKHLNWPPQLTPNVKMIRTADGRPVNMLDDDRYQVVETGEILEPVDSDAV